MTIKRIQQVEDGANRWPKGLSKAVATISLSPEELADWAKLEFFDDYDDLDYFRAAIILVDQTPYALIRHRGNPTPGTQIWIMEGSTDPRGELRRCLEGLGLSEAVITWELEVGE